MTQHSVCNSAIQPRPKVGAFRIDGPITWISVFLIGILLIVSNLGTSPPSVAAAAVLPVGFQQTLLVTGLSSPTKMSFSPDGRIFVSEKAGRLRVFDTGGQELGTFLDLTGSVITSGSRGLMGVAFDPGFAANGYVYTYYTSADTGFNRVSRFTASVSNPNLADPNSELVLLEIQGVPGWHNAGEMQFGPDG